MFGRVNILAHFSLLLLFNEGYDMAQTVSRQYLGQKPCLIPEIPCGICGGRRDSGTDYSPSISMPY